LIDLGSASLDTRMRRCQQFVECLSGNEDVSTPCITSLCHFALTPRTHLVSVGNKGESEFLYKLNHGISTDHRH
jgi:hypothetical protein